MGTKLCKNCASRIPVNAQICPNCGAKVDEKRIIIEEEQEETREEKESSQNPFGFQKHGPFYKWVTLVLAIFLGWLGIHKFYERKYYMGLLYLITGGFCCIGIVLDILVLLGKPKKYYNYY